MMLWRRKRFRGHVTRLRQCRWLIAERDRNIGGQTQGCSFNNFWSPVMPKIEGLVSFARQKVFGSSLDSARVGSPFGTAKCAGGHATNPRHHFGNCAGGKDATVW